MAVSVVLNSYNGTTGCLAFTISGSPTPTAVTVQKSIDDGLTWTDNGGSITSPRCGFLVTVPTLFRLKLQPNGELSNILSSEILTRTPISNETDISFVNSPIHIRLPKLGIVKATVRLWIWNGLLNKSLGSPNYVFEKEVVSVTDDYVNIEISEQIKAFLIGTKNQPNFSYNELTPAAITGQGVFWQVQADVETETVIERREFRTSFATLGYRYNSEQTALNTFSATQPDVSLWYNPFIHDYFKQTFDFTRSLSTATTGNVILSTPILPPAGWTRESLNPFLIVYLDKLGLFQTFTPNSKVLASEKIERSTINISHRDPSSVDNSYVHSKVNDNVDSTKSYVIETGVLSEEMVEVVRQIVYSPKIYLIRFKGDVQENTTVGATIDSTYITVDSIETTIDGATIGVEYLDFFKTHEQIPVILTDTDFVEMNRVNDKNKIDYKLKFEETNNKILDIR